MTCTKNVFADGHEWELAFDAAAGTVTLISHKPQEAPQGLVHRAAAWIKAERSMMVSGPLDDARYEARIAACQSCEFLDPAPADPVGFCKACSCGRSFRAALTVKGRMPAATCPKGKWPN